MRWWDYGTTLHETAFIDQKNIYIHIYHLLITFSFFLEKVLCTRAQYLVSCAELDNGCLTNRTGTQQERECFTTHSLRYSDDLMQVVWIWRKGRGYGLNWLDNNCCYETDEYNQTETHGICSVSRRWFQNLLAQKYDISPTQTRCSKTYTLNLRHRADPHTNRQKLNHYVVSRREKTGFLTFKKWRNFSRHHALYHSAVLYSVQL